MHLTNPLIFWAPVVLLVPAVVLAAYFYLSLKVELRLMTRHTVSRADFDARLREVISEVESMRVQIANTDARSSNRDWGAAEPGPTALNLNRRGQILRLHGKGRSSAEIASDLQISQGEVELLLKVHDLSATNPL